MSDKIKLVVDTSVFMEETEFVEKVMEEYDIIIPLVVLEELDNLKTNRDVAKSYRAKKAIKFIEVNYSKFEFDNSKSEEIKNDNKILGSAIKNSAGIMTGDICMKVKARMENIDVIEIDKNGKYKGYSVLNLNFDNEEDSKILANIYENKKLHGIDLHINEYLIVRDDLDHTIDIFRWDGHHLQKLRLPNKKVVTPKNDLQMCALDLLMNKDIPIKVIAGIYGSGKTMLSTLVGSHLVNEKGEYSKLVLIKNNDFNDSGKDIGALPGDMLDKTSIYFQSIIQHLPQGEYQEERMRNAGTLETHLTYFIKGLSINGYILVDECEDLTLSDIRLVGSRMEEDACIVFCGDWKQANGKYRNDSGMVKLMSQTKDNPMVGVIVLDRDVRSDASKIFADLY